MTVEETFLIGLANTGAHQALASDVSSAAARAAKADPGDRSDIARFEALATRLEQLALADRDAPRLPIDISDAADATLLFGTDPKLWWPELPSALRSAATTLIDQGLLPVLVVNAFRPGDAATGEPVHADPPAGRWEADDSVAGRKAVEARFRAQIGEALNPDATRRIPISPSGVQNPVVTEILREFVATSPGAARVDAPVEYRDGSKSAHPFPLRAVPLTDKPRTASLTLKLALLSIRHTEMDAVVHGAWLRNAEISRPRPAAQTDDLVYELSLRQLEALCQGQTHVHLDMYQTGLETAVIGFYRAVVQHLLRRPGSLTVQPMYFVTPPVARRAPAAPQTSDARRGNNGRQTSAPAATGRPPDAAAAGRSLFAESSPFRRGTLWST